MNLKLSEIIVIIFALAVPIGLFGLMLTPGAWDAMVRFALAPENRWTVFGGGAAAIFAVLILRVMRRFRPAAKDDPKAMQGPQLADFFWRSRRK
jgi:uncharacterized protein YjeT (DUF2065 family)